MTVATSLPPDPLPANTGGAHESVPFRQQLDIVHAALFGWPCDHLTPLAHYLDAWNIHEAGLRMLDSSRFRWDIRGKVGLWPHDKWVMTQFRGLDIWVNLFDGFVSFGVLHGAWEDHEVDFMLACLKPGDAMIDAGANIGVFSLQAATVVGETGKVYAFEPNRPVFDMLSRSVAANGLSDRFALFNAGLGATDSTGSFHLNAHATNPGSSFISTREDGERIRIMPIDAIDYAQPVRFIKIDVEGFEPNVIRGARQTIVQHRPMILTEFFPRSLRNIGGISGAEYVRMLEELDYGLTVFSNDGSRDPVTSSDASHFDALQEPINLVCKPLG